MTGGGASDMPKPGGAVASILVMSVLGNVKMIGWTRVFDPGSGTSANQGPVNRKSNVDCPSWGAAPWSSPSHWRSKEGAAESIVAASARLTSTPSPRLQNPTTLDLRS